MCFLKAVGGIVNKSKKFSTVIKMSQIHPWGFLSLLKTNFSKIFNFGHEITLIRELKSEEFIFEHENWLKWTIEGLYVHSAKNINFVPWAWNCIYGVFEVSETQFWQWKFA